MTGRDARLLLAAGLTTGTVRVALWVLPFRVVRNTVARLARPARSEALTRTHLERIVWAVRTASRLVPRATCLTQSLAAQILLARHGYSSELRLGVAREAGQFDAHAWVESNGQVVIGNADVQRYTPMTTSANRSEF